MPPGAAIAAAVQPRPLGGDGATQGGLGDGSYSSGGGPGGEGIFLQYIRSIYLAGKIRIRTDAWSLQGGGLRIIVERSF